MDLVAQPVQPIGIEKGRPQAKFLGDMLRTLQGFWSKHLHRLNLVLPKDGTEAMTGPLELNTYTVATLPDASDFGGSVIYVSDGGPVWSRALVFKTSAQSIPDSPFVTTLVWHSETYDDGGWFASSGDSIFTVPTGVTRARVYCNIEWAPAAGSHRQLSINKNGTGFQGSPRQNFPPTPVAINDINSVVSAAVDCVATDTFSAKAAQAGTGGNLNVSPSATTYFGIEAVEFAEGYGGTFQGSNGTRWVPLG